MYEDFIPKRISQLRNELNISARDMSLSLGQNPGYINSIESGKSLPSMNVFFYICEFLKISPQEFFDEANESPASVNELQASLKKLDPKITKKMTELVDAISKSKK